MRAQNFNRLAIQPTALGAFQVRKLKRYFSRDGCAGVVLMDAWLVPEYATVQYVGTKEQCIEFAVKRGALPVVQ